ncbi:hypothetical protein CLV55_101379 [Flavobacterium aciduliphilum]|uniref:Uncharacterized protein n=1 Tax=Flavobacterium aciduliphilum TaxID=1101402 RepID=A0A328YP86_9FLAO|nr:hypothetical protein CLV55_101379 [Flavobacterium aciduliphilum]
MLSRESTTFKKDSFFSKKKQKKLQTPYFTSFLTLLLLNQNK